jgi:hypothetical protein
MMMMPLSPFADTAELNTTPAFEKGYIVRKDGSRVAGEFQTKANYVYSELVFFRAEGEKTFLTYFAADISGFFIEPDFVYEAYRLPEGWRFLKFLVKDQASLLELANIGKSVFYLKMENDTLALLRYEERFVYDGERKFILKKEPYKQLLRQKFSSCASLEKQIGRLSGYDRRDLVNIVHAYNFCIGSGNSAVVQKDISHLFLGFGYTKTLTDPNFAIFSGFLDFNSSGNRIFSVTAAFNKGSARSSRTVFYGQRYDFDETSDLTSLTVRANGNIVSTKGFFLFLFGGGGYTGIDYTQKDRVTGETVVYEDSDITLITGGGFKLLFSENVYGRAEFNFNAIPGFSDGRAYINSAGQRYDVIGPDFANLYFLTFSLNFKLK